ncbi:MAG: phosphopantetheine-binding protein [Chloroflexota bacterium]
MSTDSPAPSTPHSFVETSLDLEEIQQAIDSQREARPSLGVAYEAPRTPTEKKLAEIWAEMLHIEQVGVHDDFFQLGGHSLLAVQVLTRVNEEFSIESSMDALFSAESTTLAEFARAIELARLQLANEDTLAAALQDLGQLSDEEVARLLAEE